MSYANLTSIIKQLQDLDLDIDVLNQFAYAAGAAGNINNLSGYAQQLTRLVLEAHSQGLSSTDTLAVIAAFNAGGTASAEAVIKQELQEFYQKATEVLAEFFAAINEADAEQALKFKENLAALAEMLEAIREKAEAGSLTPKDLSDARFHLSDFEASHALAHEALLKELNAFTEFLEKNESYQELRQLVTQHKVLQNQAAQAPQGTPAHAAAQTQLAAVTTQVNQTSTALTGAIHASGYGSLLNSINTRITSLQPRRMPAISEAADEASTHGFVDNRIYPHSSLDERFVRATRILTLLQEASQIVSASQLPGAFYRANVNDTRHLAPAPGVVAAY